MTRTLTNAEVAATFRRLADLLAIRGEDAYRVGAYRRAAESIGQTSASIAVLRQRGDLREIPGVGTEIARKIADLLDTGTFRLLQEVEAEFPPGVASLLSVPGIGPRRARALYQTLGIDSLDALRVALAEGRLAAAGVGPREAERIAAGLGSLQATDERLLLATAQVLGRDVMRQLTERVPRIRHMELGGSLRRLRETIGDLDIAAAAEDPSSVVAAFAALPAVARVELRGPTRCRVVLHNGFPADLWVLPAQHWGSLLHHVTGNKYHDIRLRDLALARGASLSEYGFTVGDRVIPCASEEEVYAFLGMQYIPPPMREDTGEIDLALRGELPAILQRDQVRGDLHVHTDWSDGHGSVRAMALAARGRGYAYICLTDHSQGLAVAHGLDAARLHAQRAEIDQVNAELAPFRVLQGVELEVRGDGSLDLPAEVLAALDLMLLEDWARITDTEECGR